MLRRKERSGGKKEPWTSQPKPIDFYGTGEIDEGLCAENVDTDEMPSQVDFHNTWQVHDTRFTTFSPLEEKEIGQAGEKIQWSKWRDKSESETVVIMGAG